MQYITAMKCFTTHKKIREIGGALENKMTFFPTVSLYLHWSPLKFGHFQPMKFMFLEWARLGQLTAEKKFTSLLWINDFMMNFRKSVRSLEREPPVFMVCHGNSINNTETKSFLRDPQMHMYPLSKFHFNWRCHSGVKWGGHSTHLGSRCGSKTTWAGEG